MLPDIGLQQGGMIGQAIEDLRRGQAVAFEHQFHFGVHAKPRALVPTLDEEAGATAFKGAILSRLPTAPETRLPKWKHGGA
ncbi:hypothetical protein D3C87_1763580 [compost metagenome]